MSKRHLPADAIAVAAPDAPAVDVARIDEVVDDRLGGTLGDLERGGELADPDLGVLGHAEKRTRVVREKHPACTALASHKQPQASWFPSSLFSHPALVGMRRVQRLIAVVAALAVAVPVALAAGSGTITPTSIGGVKTGLARTAYKRLLGRPVVTEFLENDNSR